MQSHSIQTYPLISQDHDEKSAKKHATAFKVIGVLELILAIALISVASVNMNAARALIVNMGNNGVAVFALVVPICGGGIWTGIMVFVCAVLGLVSSKTGSRCPVIGALVMTILSSLTSFSMICLEITGAMLAKTQELLLTKNHNDDYGTTPDPFQSEEEVQEVLDNISSNHLALVGLAVVSFIVVIVHSAFTCANACCGGNRYQNNGAVHMSPTQNFSVQPGLYQYQQQTESDNTTNNEFIPSTPSKNDNEEIKAPL